MKSINFNLHTSLALSAALLSLSLPSRAADHIGTDYLLRRTILTPNANSISPTAKRSLAQGLPKAAAKAPEPAANSVAFPKQILKTGVSLSAVGLSPNSMQLAKNIGLYDTLGRISALAEQVARGGTDVSLKSLSDRQDLRDAKQTARLVIQKTNLEIDATAAQITAEKELYNEILTKFKDDRDKAIAMTNAISFISNGALWAVTEALVIPTYKYPVYNVPAGIVGIPAGLVPSAASMYTFKQISGKKKTSEVEPNMLAKVFDYPTNAEIEYPQSVWNFLNESPADQPEGKTRIKQLTDRWIADSNMPAFTQRDSRKQLDVLTASVSQRKGLTIDTLTARTVMLDQLLAEIMKMKRMLLELEMTATGDKRFIASN